MTRTTAIAVAALCLLGAGLIAKAQNRIASGSTYHTAEPRNVMPYSIWTNCVMWLTCDQNPSDNATWTMQSFGSEPTKNNGTQATTNSRPSYTNNLIRCDGVDDFVFANGCVSSISNKTTGAVGFWTKIASTNATQNKPFAAWKSSGNLSGLQILWNNNPTLGWQALCYVTNGASWNMYQSSSVATFSPTQWVHVVLVHNGTIPILYLNATSQSVTYINQPYKTHWFKEITTGADAIDATTIGCVRFNETNNYPWNGWIDDVRVYTAALTASDVTNLYNATKSPTPARP